MLQLFVSKNLRGYARAPIAQICGNYHPPPPGAIAAPGY
jgi:hypothetical protein